MPDRLLPRAGLVNGIQLNGRSVDNALAWTAHPDRIVARAESMDCAISSMDYRWLEGHELYDYGGSSGSLPFPIGFTITAIDFTIT